jgi:hypothetical protein
MSRDLQIRLALTLGGLALWLYLGAVLTVLDRVP